MQYTVIIAFLLAAAVSAAPLDPAVTPAVRATPFDAPVTPATARAIARRGQAPINDCGDSSFSNQSSGGSPRISDCQQIISDLKAIGPHTFDVVKNFVEPVTVKSSGTCSFIANVVGEGFSGYIGDQDIIDLITSSIEKFSWNGLVWR